VVAVGRPSSERPKRKRKTADGAAGVGQLTSPWVSALGGRSPEIAARTTVGRRESACTQIWLSDWDRGLEAEREGFEPSDDLAAVNGFETVRGGL
jgi:hypothetical protein